MSSSTTPIPSCHLNAIAPTRMAPTGLGSGSVYRVCQCLFRSLEPQSGFGGAIEVTLGGMFEVLASQFISCKAPSGGAISVTTETFKLIGCCGITCTSTQSGSFVSLSLIGNDATMTDDSVLWGSVDWSGTFNMLLQEDDSVILERTNVTSSSAATGSLFNCRGDIGAMVKAQYLTVSKLKGGSAIDGQGSACSITVCSSNFYDNPLTIAVLRRVSGGLVVDSCIFMNNGQVFGWEGGDASAIQVINCVLSGDCETSDGITYSGNNQFNTSTASLAFSLVNDKAECPESTLPISQSAVETVTPRETQSPIESQTPSSKWSASERLSPSNLGASTWRYQDSTNFPPSVLLKNASEPHANSAAMSASSALTASRKVDDSRTLKLTRGNTRTDSIDETRFADGGQSLSHESSSEFRFSSVNEGTAHPNTSADLSASASPDASGDLSASANPNTSVDLSASASPDASVDLSASAHPSASGDLIASAHPGASVDLDASASPDASADLSASASPGASVDLSASAHPSTSVDLIASAHPGASVDLDASASPDASVDRPGSAHPSTSVDLSASASPDASVNRGASADLPGSASPDASVDLSASANPSTSVDLMASVNRGASADRPGSARPRASKAFGPTWIGQGSREFVKSAGLKESPPIGASVRLKTDEISGNQDGTSLEFTATGKSNGISAGAVAGVVVGIMMLLVALIVALVLRSSRKSPESDCESTGDEVTMNSDIDSRKSSFDTGESMLNETFE